MDRRKLLENPYRPGAGHIPPFLAGRIDEQEFFKRVIRQDNPTDNILITGLRGFGKTVLLSSLRAAAEQDGWLWVGNDLSESASLTEERLALRILTDLSQAMANRFASIESGLAGSSVHAPHEADEQRASDEQQLFETLKGCYETSPGLPSDRLKSVMSRASSMAARARVPGIILAYDEAQCLCDHAERNEFPMSMLLDTVASGQKKATVVPCLLILCGLPHLLNALTETRTYTERMFHVMRLDRLSRDDTWAALTRPLSRMMPPLYASPKLIAKVVDLTNGYPYFIQFFGKELVEQLLRNGGTLGDDEFPSTETLDHLDSGLFGARWNNTTDKQRNFLRIVASRGQYAAAEFSAQEVSTLSKNYGDSEVSNAQATQLLQALCERGIVYRTRHGFYAFTVPMSDEMILRRLQSEEEVVKSWQEPPPPKTLRKKATSWLWFT